MEKSILCLFYCFFFALASILTARFNRRSIKETKNALFHARSGNGPLVSISTGQKNQKNLGQKNLAYAQNDSVFYLADSNLRQIELKEIKARFHYERRMQHSFFVLLIFPRLSQAKQKNQ